jgi:hypothetical protein
MNLHKIANKLISEKGKTEALNECDRNIKFYNHIDIVDKFEYIQMWEAIKEIIKKKND